MSKTTIVAVLLALAVAACAGESGHESTPRIHVDIESVSKADDVQPVDGIASAGQPDADEFRVFAEAGYVAVVDLRGPDEDRGLDEAKVIAELGLDYVQLPIVGDDAINFENAEKLDSLLADYDGPVLLHCGSGNRVGAMLALRKSLDGAQAEEALDYGRSAGLTRLEPVVKKRLAETN